MVSTGTVNEKFDMVEVVDTNPTHLGAKRKKCALIALAI
jgi:hypothetical protein